jgi:hypothetical protein
MALAEPLSTTLNPSRKAVRTLPRGALRGVPAEGVCRPPEAPARGKAFPQKILVLKALLGCCWPRNLTSRARHLRSHARITLPKWTRCRCVEGCGLIFPIGYFVSHCP